jgi:type II secretory pathway component PulJ
METLLGILMLAVYVFAILALSAAVTFAVVKISPSKSAKKDKQEQQA